MNNVKPVIILEPRGRRRPGLYADIPVPVLQVPSEEEGGPGGPPNLLKEEEKNKDDNSEEEMEGKRRNAEDMQDSLLVEEGMMVAFALVHFFTCLLPLQLLIKGFFFSPKRS